MQADKLDSLAYAGFERFIGSAHGRSGTFVLRHNATSLGEESSLSWIVVPGSGTGELTGITGAGKIDASDGVHVYSLEYEL